MRPFPRSGYLSGGLNAKIDLKSSEMAGNESKINKRNDNFNNYFNCSLFLISMYSSYDKKRNHHEYLRLNREWHNLNLVKSGGKSPPCPFPCAVPALYLQYWTYLSLSLCDRCHWYVSVSKNSIFRTLFPRLFKLYTVVYISWCRSVQFHVDHLNQESLLQWKKKQSRRQFPQPRGVGAIWKYIFISESCCIKLSIFRCSVQSYFTLITRVKNLCFSLPA